VFSRKEDFDDLKKAVGLEEIERDQDRKNGAASSCPIIVIVIIKLLR
jgi:hypothetical protein